MWMQRNFVWYLFSILPFQFPFNFTFIHVFCSANPMPQEGVLETDNKKIWIIQKNNSWVVIHWTTVFAISEQFLHITSQIWICHQIAHVKTYKSTFNSCFYLVYSKRYTKKEISAWWRRPCRISQFWGILGHFWASYTAHLDSAPLNTFRNVVYYKYKKPSGFWFCENWPCLYAVTSIPSPTSGMCHVSICSSSLVWSCINLCIPSKRRGMNLTAIDAQRQSSEKRIKWKDWCNGH